jgi:hypothetical protein
MSAQSGTHQLGPRQATLTVRTGRAGAAAKAGHDLVIEVTSWEATLILAEDRAESSIELSADATSLRVIGGSGGIQPLGDDDKRNIEQTIDDEVLKRESISFRSTEMRPQDGGGIGVEGDLTILGRAGPTSFDLMVSDDGSLAATARFIQSDWGMKPYSALFGALKVADEVVVELDGHL